MKPDDQHEATLFQAAAKLTGGARVSFLDKACHGDAALHQRLEALLAAHEQSQGVLAESAAAAKGTMKIEFTDAPDELQNQPVLP